MKVFVDLTVNQRNKKGTSHLFYTFQRLIVVIQIQKSGNHRLGFIFPNIFIQLRLIKQEHCNQIIVLIFNLHNRRIIQQIINNNTLQTDSEIFFCIGKFHLCLLSRLWKFIQSDFRKYTGNRLMILLFFPRQFRKFCIHPQQSAMCIQQCIRHRQIPDQTLLHLTILRGKCNQLIEQTRPIVIIQNHNYRNIDSHKNCHHGTCTPVNNINGYIHGN